MRTGTGAQAGEFDLCAAAESNDDVQTQSAAMNDESRTTDAIEAARTEDERVSENQAQKIVASGMNTLASSAKIEEQEQRSILEQLAGRTLLRKARALPPHTRQSLGSTA